jgi:2-keto-4-pentenoate hydratase/2-oxohepta-3-ene-1,7-dioic acid hydratase in catechol pathway
MRLATIQTKFGPRAAVRAEDGYIDLHAADPALPAGMRSLLELLNRRPGAVSAVRQTHQGEFVYAEDKAKLLPPAPDPQKIICLGLNYLDHAKESGSPVPKDPILFSKYPTALIGHEDNIVVPSVSNEVDYEAELVVVVGKRGRPQNTEDAMSYVAGYTIGNDISARDWQLKKDGKQWMVGKTFDTFAPTGPEIVTPDEIADPHQLGVRLRLNGTTMQDSNTRHMIFPVGAILSYLGQVFTLEPGDLIFTGTPPGVGFARKPPVYLKDGDIVEVEIDGLGTLRNRVVRH